METFKDYAFYYNMFYKDKNYKKEACDVVSLMRMSVEEKNENKLLVIGCGTGRHDKEFQDLGFQVHGIDLSPNMVEQARKNSKRNGLNCTYEVSDIRGYQTADVFDCAVSLFHVISYQNENEDVLSSFRSCNHALKNGSCFVFDAWYGPGVLTERPECRIKKAEDDEKEVIRFATPNLYPNKNIVRVHYDILIKDKESERMKQVSEDHNMRYFFEPEMREYLNETGFELERCIDCSTLKEPDFDSWTAYFVARKIHSLS